MGANQTCSRLSLRHDSGHVHPGRDVAEEGGRRLNGDTSAARHKNALPLTVGLGQQAGGLLLRLYIQHRQRIYIIVRPHFDWAVVY